MVSKLGTLRIKGGGFELRVCKLNVSSSLLLTYGLRSRVCVTVRLTVHPCKQTFVKSNNLVIQYKQHLWCTVVY
jgi:hypothetical protein